MSKKPKIGAGTLSAMGRQGFKEIRGALYPDSNIAREAEVGTYGTLTQGEIAQQKSAEEVSDTVKKDGHSESQFDERMAELKQTQEREVPEPEMEIE